MSRQMKNLYLQYLPGDSFIRELTIFRPFPSRNSPIPYSFSTLYALIHVLSHLPVVKCYNGHVRNGYNGLDCYIYNGPYL